jgi:hypothetical protein
MNQPAIPVTEVICIQKIAINFSDNSFLVMFSSPPYFTLLLLRAKLMATFNI